MRNELKKREYCTNIVLLFFRPVIRSPEVPWIIFFTALFPFFQVLQYAYASRERLFDFAAYDAPKTHNRNKHSQVFMQYTQETKRKKHQQHLWCTLLYSTAIIKRIGVAIVLCKNGKG